MRRPNFLYAIAAVHSLGGLSLAAAGAIYSWPFMVYVVAFLALVIGVVIAAVADA
jgi:hypothetical protein